MYPHKADVFQAIADPTRRAILVLLAAQSLTINALADNFNISRPAVSKHVKVLQESGLITIEDLGRERHCSLQESGFNEVKQWLEFFEGFWKGKLKQLEKLLQQRHGG